MESECAGRNFSAHLSSGVAPGEERNPPSARGVLGLVVHVVFRAPLLLPPLHLALSQFKTHKLIFRRYAGLYFTVCVDVTDNELSYLEAIHLFVETLDHYFGNVCELDLVFNFAKVYALLDEFILGGELLETSQKAMLDRMLEVEKAANTSK